MLNLPERLYHFTEAKHGLDDLRNRRLKIAQFNNLNDPFELRSVDLSDPTNKLAFDLWIMEIAPRFGLLCFSQNWKAIPQWSHYAERHRGVCLGFDVSGAPDMFGSVCYEPRRKKFPEDVYKRQAESFGRHRGDSIRRWQFPFLPKPAVPGDIPCRQVRTRCRADI